jgi:3-deoxy-D-manno-octulosonate 8-phosphate phosphatase KdsC-like HAD superfamily phosphatase
MDLRDYVKKRGAEGEIKRIEAEVDSDLYIFHTILYHRTGRGLIREVWQFILRAMGKWEEWVEKVPKMGYK